VQVDTFKSVLKAPGTERLKLNCDILFRLELSACDRLISSFAFNFKQRHCKAVAVLLEPFQKTPLADEYPAVGRCSFTPG